MADLNQIINTAVPWILVIIVIAWIWSNFKDGLLSLANFVKNLLTGGTTKVRDAYETTLSQEIVYK